MRSQTQEHPKLSAIIVGRESGEFSLAAARSLRRGWLEAGYRPGDLDLIVVDNASRGDQSPWYSLLRAEGARVLIQDNDLGFSGGVEAGFAASRGGEHDYVALLRPDVFFLPGCVRELVRHLEAHPEVGAVAPRAYLDEERVLQHVPPSLPGAWDEIEAQLARLSRHVARHRARRRTRVAQRWWQAELPTVTPVLDGACMLVPRAVAAALAGVMDRRYLSGYGDADLCRRLRERGLELVHHPRAHVLVHAREGLGVTPGEADRRRELARRAYLARWSRPLARSLLSWVERAVARWPEERLGRPAHPYEPVRGGSPIEIPLPRDQTWWMELSRDALGESRLVSVFEGATWCLPPESWEWLAQGRWYLRAIDPARGKVRGAWSFSKSEPARSEAVGLPSHLHPELQRDWIGDLSDTVRGLVSDTGWHRVQP